MRKSRVGAPAWGGFSGHQSVENARDKTEEKLIMTGITVVDAVTAAHRVNDVANAVIYRTDKVGAGDVECVNQQVHLFDIVKFIAGVVVARKTAAEHRQQAVRTRHRNQV